ncbi:hypothetical protein PR048_030951 [Dryococelus australis]|uniref:Uncharacterized protein n=1 Tax=Dryococelus australis TaxID=614101 RepID=A0ABQ9GAC6_9NEOP|nr:hypothetical protein PR048_030951 [Dryococelus australis]
MLHDDRCKDEGLLPRQKLPLYLASSPLWPSSLCLSLRRWPLCILLACFSTPPSAGRYTTLPSQGLRDPPQNLTSLPCILMRPFKPPTLKHNAYERWGAGRARNCRPYSCASSGEAALNIEPMRVKRGEYEAALECKGVGKREIPGKILHAAGSSGTILIRKSLESNPVRLGWRRCTPGFSHVRNVATANDRRVFSGHSHFPLYFNSSAAPYSHYFTSPPSALNTSLETPEKNLSVLLLRYSGMQGRGNGISQRKPTDQRRIVLHDSTCATKRRHFAEMSEESQPITLSVSVYMMEDMLQMKDVYDCRCTQHGTGGRCLDIFRWFNYSPPTKANWGQFPARLSRRFLHVGIVPDDASGRRVFSGISRFPCPFIPALLHTHLASPTSALRASMVRAAQISSLTGINILQ